MENVTFAQGLPLFLHGTKYNYCLLSTSLFPSLNDGLTAAPLKRERRKLGRERKDRYEPERHCCHQSMCHEPNCKRVAAASGSLMKPQSDPAHDLQFWKAAEPTVSPLALKSTSCLRLNAVQACKGWYTENDIKVLQFLEGLSLYLSWIWKLRLGQKLPELTLCVAKRRGTLGLCTEGSFLPNLAGNTLQLPLTLTQLEIVRF